MRMMMAADSDKKYKCYSKKLGNTDGSGCMPSISVPHSCLNDAHVNVAIERMTSSPLDEHKQEQTNCTMYECMSTLLWGIPLHIPICQM
jgi:hypothetical protein